MLAKIFLVSANDVRAFTKLCRLARQPAYSLATSQEPVGKISSSIPILPGDSVIAEIQYKINPESPVTSSSIMGSICRKIALKAESLCRYVPSSNCDGSSDTESSLSQFMDLCERLTNVNYC